MMLLVHSDPFHVHGLLLRASKAWVHDLRSARLQGARPRLDIDHRGLHWKVKARHELRVFTPGACEPCGSGLSQSKRSRYDTVASHRSSGGHLNQEKHSRVRGSHLRNRAGCIEHWLLQKTTPFATRCHSTHCNKSSRTGSSWCSNRCPCFSSKSSPPQ